jgi:glutamine amidotransferase
MQVMFSEGEEHSITTPGLAQWRGAVTQLTAKILPHMGFNSVTVSAGSKMFSDIETEQFYFLHSFAAKELDFERAEPFIKPLVHKSNYYEDFIAAIEDGPLWATQFHPEKSGPAGLKLIENWLKQLND